MAEQKRSGGQEAALFARMSPDLKARLDAESERSGVPIAVLVRRFIERGLRPAQQAGDRQADAEVIELVEDTCRRVLVEEGLIKESNPDEADDGKPRFGLTLNEVIFEGLPRAPSEEARKQEEARRGRARKSAK